MMKKGQSQVVTSVLLILIVIALAVIVLNFSTSFVNDKLSETGCFDVIQGDGVRFVDNKKYTCFKEGEIDEIFLQVSVGDVNDSLSGFLIELGGASTRSIEIKDGEIIEGVRMSEGAYGDPVSLPPSRNSARTYVIQGSFPDIVKIYPILNDDQVCEASDSIDSLPLCSG